MGWVRRAVWLLGLWMVLTCGRAHASGPEVAGPSVEDWATTFVAARDPYARVPDIYVDISPSRTVPGAWKIRISEHIANAEQPLTLEVDGVSPERVAVSPFAGDVWGEVSSDLQGGAPQLLGAITEIVELFDLPQWGIQLALYQLEDLDPAIRYVRAQTLTFTASDVLLTVSVL